MIIDSTAEQAKPRIVNLLTFNEGKKLEFKRVSGQMVGKALIAISAFANTEGGILVLGLADRKQEIGAKRLYGIEENVEAVDDLIRKLDTQITPPVEGLKFLRWPCTLRDGIAGHVVLVQIGKSDKVHSIVDQGTWKRMDSSNRQMSAVEVTELSYQRGVRSAESETLPIDFDLLNTNVLSLFLSARGLKIGSFTEQLERVGLAVKVEGRIMPTRAAVLLFADEPGSLLAAHGSRADIRLMVYDGKQVVPEATPNLRKTPKTIRGPLIEQIDVAIRVVLDELAQGLTLASSGFKAKHSYPQRVVKEAIVNAVIHRDYRLNRDIFYSYF